MSQQQHTQEPWPPFTDIATTITSDPEGTPVAILSWDDYIRARACVNACEGIQTNHLESVTGKLAISSSISMWQSYCDKKMQLEDAIEQRDTLLSALEDMVKWFSSRRVFSDTVRPINEQPPEIQRAMLAIDSVKGGAA